MARTFTFAAPRPRGLLGRRFEPDEQLVLGTGFVGGLLLLWLVPGIPFKIGAFVGWLSVCASAVLVPYQGRTYLRWWEINRTYRRSLRNGSLLYASSAPQAGVHLSGQPVPIALPPGIPADLRWIDAPTAYGQIAVLLQPGEQMFCAAIEVEAQRDFGSLDLEDKESLIGAWEYLLRSTADSGGRIRRLQWISRMVPADPNAHANDAATRADPLAADWLHASYTELQQAVALFAEDRRLLLVVGIPYTPDLVAEARRYRTLAEGFAVCLGKEIEAFIRSLGHGQLRHVRNLDEPALGSYLQHAYGPDHWLDDTIGMNRTTAWPAEIDARNTDHMISRSFEGADPWYSATAWVKKWPVLQVSVNFMAPLILYVKDIVFTVAVTMDLVPGDQALTEAMADSTNEIGQADHKAGKLKDPRETAAQRRSLSTVQEIADGAAGIRLAGWVTVTSRSKQALDRDKDTVRAAAARAQIRLEYCEKEHHRAMANTLPLCTGLLRS
ncbi:SCO6880 family protein [Streptomyces bobili]|uniref:SCO6880 family protein n=1 Tax=Streptomyces bobili TaxID=67280 RepID=UPI003439646E